MVDNVEVVYQVEVTLHISPVAWCETRVVMYHMHHQPSCTRDRSQQLRHDDYVFLAIEIPKLAKILNNIMGVQLVILIN